MVAPCARILISGFAGEAPVVGRRCRDPKVYALKSNQRASLIKLLIFTNNNFSRLSGVGKWLAVRA
jgi:hypothetical protein